MADLELRHRRRARSEDRIRNAKDTGLRNLPLPGRRNRKPWLRLSTLAPFADLIAAGLARLNTLPHPT